ncbi:MAG: flagellar basal body rod protein FlgB [Nitrospirae bacterium]|nr:flagellar basal body rod protein FlgB [Nitrospirota bacterium]
MPGIADALMGETGLLLQKVMDFRTLQHNLISANLANAETPNYKAVHVDFEGLLREAMRKEGTLRMKMTDQKHFSGFQSDLAGVQPQHLVEAPPTSGNDYNSVDAEREMTRMAENQMMYQTAAEILRGRINTIRTVIMESGR